MRLINIYTLELEEFFTTQTPRYYILSHRWGPEEVNYKDYRKKRTTDGPGYRKIVDACDFARTWQSSGNDALPVRYLWIDTCCIDKRSSAELSEAINSMFKWYRLARMCIVYLADVSSMDCQDVVTENALGKCDWFKRGWTLQELIAPGHLVFSDVNWKIIGSIVKSYGINSYSKMHRPYPDLLEVVCSITRIPKRVLATCNGLRTATPSIAQRMSWAAQRATTREEDMAYCLMGIFDVNMPLLYGEGTKAFLRLQEEILRRSRDQSILAWGVSHDDPTCRLLRPRTGPWGLLAHSPLMFRDSGDVVFNAEAEDRPSKPFYITSEGIETEAILKSVDPAAMRYPLYATDSVWYPVTRAVKLNCRRRPSVGAADEAYTGLPYLFLPLVPYDRLPATDSDERKYYGRLNITSLLQSDELDKDAPELRASIVVPHVRR